MAETVPPTRSDLAIRIFSPRGYPLGDGTLVMPNPRLGEKLVYRTKEAKLCDDVGAGIDKLLDPTGPESRHRIGADIIQQGCQ